MLVFAAITPHPPLLIPTIGKKEALGKIQKTKTAMESLEEDLYLAKPNIIIVISPHAHNFSDSFALNVCPEYETDLRQFGDLATKLKFKGEMDMPSQLREMSLEKKIKTSMISEPRLDHGATVPLYYLTKHITDIALMPISFTDLDWKTHFDFGYMLKELIMNTNKRVAVIASGDLSHALTSDAPAGYSPVGQKFDDTIRELLSTNNIAGFLQLEEDFVEQAAQCGLRSFLILLGILRDFKYTYKEYSYEGPFGVGYLTANFQL
ncbi:MAG: hypothetical protein A2538_05080 [Candidatus Magasanikbacteria bacterium RIFOXYD2_FULL_41_14]|uniref:Extradiol ring-cleavage dioxygenase class III enzyme subunit B domain-containing protein n=1 Tax=Candidatus Magasanikbacteria bacterium RIFOXYD2_FULL_41_14 TaxID=1798709 RepID=A0A1F6PFT5_9BACT|nr:MAG: hypothetical protein A2538_05080 [Candidatus Magasanikbacteria bacterium RIFOXYD2_FULL_41_14]